MILDTTKYAMLGDVEHLPTCKECQGYLIRLAEGVWICPDLDCDAIDETDAQLDNRLTSEAEAAYERQQERAVSAGGLLDPQTCQRSLKR